MATPSTQPRLREERGSTTVTCAQERLGEGVLLELIRIPAGTFMMGSPDDEQGRFSSEGPQHRVSVPEFWMGQYPVTQQEWRVVAGFPQVKQELDPDPSRFKGSRRPVERVSWNDALEFCQRLTQHTGRTYRLPSEAEWEYACRAGTTTPFHFGPTLSAKYSNYDATQVYGPGEPGDYRQETVDVDHFGVANDFGLCDMHGNVWEWCQDDWHKNYEGAPPDGRPWLENPSQSNSRVYRGGSWFDSPRYCRSAYRYRYFPVIRLNRLGFRVVLAPP
ncbi:MAG: formylglycine-generating enzyme family protein [Leptolyngbyaceae bacterium]|nr:formylglycine-generating enzyme family protein [Leptolyngbyaceae bacterium]